MSGLKQNEHANFAVASMHYSKSDILKILWQYSNPYRGRLLLAIFALFITSMSVLMMAKSVQYVIDNGLAKHDMKTYNSALFILLAVVVMLSIFTFIRFYNVTKIGEMMVADIKRDFFNKLVKLSPGFFEMQSSGEVIARMTSDATVLLNVLSSNISFAARHFITLIGGIVILMFISPKLTGLIFSVIPLILLPLIYFGRRVKKLARISQDKIGELSSLCEQSIAYIRTIQAYRREDFESLKFADKVAEQLNATYNRIFIRGILTALIILLAFGGIVFVLWAGGQDVIADKITPGQLSAFVFIAILSAAAGGAISEIYTEIQRAIASADRIFTFMYQESDVQNKDTAENITFSSPKISLRNVSYAYSSNPTKLVLKNISIDFLPGKVNALVGRSGAGKSTIFSLLQRFYDVKEGGIFFDEHNILDLTLNSLRSHYTYVAQDPVIFSSTIFENIRYGKLDATEEEVLKVAKNAECMDFITHLPNGIHSEIGEKGVRLSGGQKQRLAIARAMLNDPKVLLLDEATSALDSENEQKVQVAISNLIKGRTCIVIAHRFSTIRDADQIIVLDNGSVAEFGTHKDLISKGGLYERIAKIGAN